MNPNQISEIPNPPKEDQKSDNDTEERLKKIYYIAVKTRNFEITQLVQRNNFFMIFQGVLLACIIYSSNTVPFVHTMICLAGFLVAFWQTKVAAGAKFWQEYWESEVVEAETQLGNFYKMKNIHAHLTLSFIPLFHKDLITIREQVIKQLSKSKQQKQNIFSSIYNEITTFFNTEKLVLSKPSVSKIPIQVGRCLTCIWFLLFLSTISIGNNILKGQFYIPWSYPIEQGHRIDKTDFKGFEFKFFHGFPTHDDPSKREITNEKPIKLEIVKE